MTTTTGDLTVHDQAWGSLVRAHAALSQQLERALVTKHDLPLSWFGVLVSLNTSRGEVRLQELVDCTLMTKSGVTRLIDRMEAAGLVTRRSCPSDRRGAFAVITDAGRESLRQAQPTHDQAINDHLARHLSSADATQLRKLLQAINEGLSSPRGCAG